VGPRAVLDAVVKRKIPSLRRESNPRTPIAMKVGFKKSTKFKQRKLYFYEVSSEVPD
jgi:hypothetical protein